MSALTPNATKTLAEVGYLLIVISGVRFAVSEVLPIIATHWGQFG